MTFPRESVRGIFKCESIFLCVEKKECWIEINGIKFYPDFQGIPPKILYQQFVYSGRTIMAKVFFNDDILNPDEWIQYNVTISDNYVMVMIEK